MTVDAPRQSYGWVPAEHRFFGLDRRTMRPALVVLVVALLLIYGWQAINAVIPWHNEITAGQVLDLGDNASAVPPVGWELKDGTLTGNSATSIAILLAKSGTTIELRGAAFTGTANGFLDQVIRADGHDPAEASGSRGTIITNAGLVGVTRASGGPSGEELDAAFKMATGTPDAMSAAPALLVRVRSAPGQFTQYQDVVVALLTSIAPGLNR